MSLKKEIHEKKEIYWKIQRLISQAPLPVNEMGGSETDYLCTHLERYVEILKSIDAEIANNRESITLLDVGIVPGIRLFCLRKCLV